MSLRCRDASFSYARSAADRISFRPASPQVKSKLAMRHMKRAGRVHIRNSSVLSMICESVCKQTSHPTKRTALVIEGAPSWARPLMLHPYSRTRLLWDSFSMLFLIYNAVLIPFRMCFQVTDYCPSPIWIFESCVDWFFVFDVLLNFMTAVVANEGMHNYQGEVIADGRLRVIASNYVNGWLLTDFIASLPLDFFFSLQANGCSKETAADSGQVGGVEVLKLARIMRLTKLLKLVRLLKLSETLSALTDHIPIPPEVIKFVELLFVVSFVGHIMACLWYYVGLVSHLDARGGNSSSITGAKIGFPEYTSWIGHAGLAPASPDGAVSWDEVSSPYIAAVYWSFTTMTTVGYGDLTPQSNSERLFASGGMIIGTALFGYIIGSTTALLASRHSRQHRLKIKMARLNSYMEARSLPRSLKVRLRKYFRYFWSHALTSTDDEEEILSNLSDSLHEELMMITHEETIRNVPLFGRWSTEHAGSIPLLFRALRPTFIMPSDVIFEQGMPANELSIISSGRVEVIFSYLDQVIKLCEISASSSAAYFGEIGILEPSVLRAKHAATTAIAVSDVRQRTATVMAMQFTELFSLTREEILIIFDEFPHLCHEIVTIGARRLARTDALRDREHEESKAAAYAERFRAGILTLRRRRQEEIARAPSQTLDFVERQSNVQDKPRYRYHNDRDGKIASRSRFIATAKRRASNFIANMAFNSEESCALSPCHEAAESSTRERCGSFTGETEGSLSPSLGHDRRSRPSSVWLASQKHAFAPQAADNELMLAKALSTKHGKLPALKEYLESMEKIEQERRAQHDAVSLQWKAFISNLEDNETQTPAESSENVAHRLHESMAI